MTPPMTAKLSAEEVKALADRLRLHAHDLVNGGTNAGDLRNDLNAASAALAQVREAEARAEWLDRALTLAVAKAARWEALKAYLDRCGEGFNVGIKAEMARLEAAPPPAREGSE